MKELEIEEENIQKLFNILIDKQLIHDDGLEEISNKSQVKYVVDKLDRKYNIFKNKSDDEIKKLYQSYFKYFKAYRFSTLGKGIDKIINEFDFLPTIKQIIKTINKVTGTDKSDLGLYDNY